MKVSFSDLQRKSREIIQALERNERITIVYRGRPKAIMQPTTDRSQPSAAKAKDHPAFGLWADHDDLKDVAGCVRQLRKGRFNAL